MSLFSRSRIQTSPSLKLESALNAELRTADVSIEGCVERCEMLPLHVVDEDLAQMNIDPSHGVSRVTMLVKEARARHGITEVNSASVTLGTSKCEESSNYVNESGV